MAIPQHRPSTAPAGDTTDPTFTRFQRMLLATDGTVTHILEAYAEEPIEVVKLLQQFDVAGDLDAALGLPPDEKVLRRHVVLRGVESRRHLLYAEAVVAVGRIEPAVLDGLLATDKPIGVLLAERRTETFREILQVGREPAGPVGAHFGLARAAALVFRTYVIVAGGQPLIQITEKFPTDHFRGVPV